MDDDKTPEEQEAVEAVLKDGSGLRTGAGGRTRTGNNRNLMRATINLTMAAQATLIGRMVSAETTTEVADIAASSEEPVTVLGYLVAELIDTGARQAAGLSPELLQRVVDDLTTWMVENEGGVLNAEIITRYLSGG